MRAGADGLSGQRARRPLVVVGGLQGAEAAIAHEARSHLDSGATTGAAQADEARLEGRRPSVGAAIGVRNQGLSGHVMRSSKRRHVSGGFAGAAARPPSGEAKGPRTVVRGPVGSRSRSVSSSESAERRGDTPAAGPPGHRHGGHVRRAHRGQGSSDVNRPADRAGSAGQTGLAAAALTAAPCCRIGGGRFIRECVGVGATCQIGRRLSAARGRDICSVRGLACESPTVVAWTPRARVARPVRLRSCVRAGHRPVRLLVAEKRVNKSRPSCWTNEAGRRWLKRGLRPLRTPSLASQGVQTQSRPRWR
jgi:hypothetical protein